MSQKKLLLNSFSNTLNLIVNIFVTLIMTPVFLNYLGHHDYGIWELITVTLGYMGLLDFGLRSAVVRFVAFYRTQNAHNTINRLYATALSFMLSIGLLLMLAFFIWSEVNPSSLSEEATGAEKYALFLFVIGICLPFSFSTQVAEAVLEGKQRYLSKSLTNIVVRITGSIYLFYFLNVENGLVLLSQVLLISTIIRLLTFMALLFFNQEKVSPFHKPSHKLFKELFQFGSKSLINGIAFSLQSTSGVFIIGIILGPAMVPLYSIPRSLVKYVSTFMLALGKVFLPYFTQQIVSENHQELQRAFVFYSKLLIWFLLTSVAYILIFGSDFIHFWLKGQLDKEQVQFLIYFFCSGLIIEKLNPLGNDTAAALNRHGIFAKVRSIAAVFIFIFSYFLITYIGLVGAILAEIIVLSVMVPTLLKYCCGYIELQQRHYYKHCWLRNALVFSIVLAQGYFYKIFLEPESLLDTLVALANVAMCSIVIFWLFGLNKDEKEPIMLSYKKWLKL